MKRLSYMLFILLLLSVYFCSCSNRTDTEVSGETAESAVPVDKTSIEILSLDDQEVKSVLNSFSNLKALDNIYINVPEKASVYDYISMVPGDAEGDMELYEKEYREMFKYLFPGHELKEECLFYRGGSSDVEYDNAGNRTREYNKVKEWHEAIVSGKEGRVSFFYDETRNCDMTEWKSSVSLELSNPVGYGYAVINKGKTVELTNPMIYDEALEAERYIMLNSYDPAEWLGCVGTYPPDSTESFPLQDKEMPINEAAAFFEHYINQLPYPEESNMETRVVAVDVLKINKNSYGYYFLTTGSYKGIPFDHMRSGTKHSDTNGYIAMGGNAFMLESSEVDVIYGYYRKQEMRSVNAYKEIVSFERAAETMSEWLTQGAKFEVQKVEFVYTQMPEKTEGGYIDTDNYSCEVTPAWKFTLFDPEDGMAYVCYVDAGDENGFRFYKTPNGERRLE